MRLTPFLFGLAPLAFVVACGGGDSTPVASATPPPPTPTPEPTTAACPLGLTKGRGTGTGCAEPPGASPTLLRVVEDAANKAKDDRPDNFELDNIGFRVKDLDLYYKLVVDNLNASGQVCAMRDGPTGREIAVKNTNAFNEQFQIWVTSGHMRLGPQSFRARCAPAYF
jgi:hypothetical protein